MEASNEFPAEVADDPTANEAYEGQTVGAPGPPRILPDELAKVQSPEQGGDTGEGGATGTPAGTPRTAGPGSEDDGERLTGDYDKATQAQLDAEISAREAEGRTITVEGTGANGNVTNADRANALTADDEAASA